MRPLVIGVGNRWRGDDGIGPLTIDALAALGTDGPDADLIALDGEPGRLVAAWEDRSRVVVVDAIVTGAAPGTVHCVTSGFAGRGAGASSHGNGIAEAVALGRALDRLPEQLVVIGIEPGRLDHGAELSPTVAAALDTVVRLVCERVDEEAGAPCA